MTLIDIKNVSLILKEKVILQNISCSFDKNEITTIIGPNGGGKTSLIKLILGIYKPSCGFVRKKKNLKIGYMPQRFQINPIVPMTVRRFLNNVDTLGSLKASYLADFDMTSLSGGEMQRVLLAYALQNKPDVLLLDEPTAGLDVSGEQSLYQFILDYQKNSQCCIILVSHDLHFVMKQTKRVLCLHKHICCSGLPETVSSNSYYQSLFGVQVPYIHHHNHSHERNDDE